jgi:hypothetical protein
MAVTSNGQDGGQARMAKGRDRPRHQEKRKPKEKAPKIQPASAYDQPMSVEVVKKKRKPRSEPGEEA